MRKRRMCWLTILVTSFVFGGSVFAQQPVRIGSKPRAQTGSQGKNGAGQDNSGRKPSDNKAPADTEAGRPAEKTENTPDATKTKESDKQKTAIGLPKIESVSPRSGGPTSTISFTLDHKPAREDLKLDDMVLFIKGEPVKGIAREYADLEHRRVYFTLKQTPENTALWQQVLRISGNGNPEIRAGWSSTGPLELASDAGNFALSPDAVRLMIFLVLFVALFFAFFLLAVKSNLLKNEDLVSGIPGAGPYAYSLGRVQMAWWFFITLASILMIWLVTEAFTVTNQVLILIGISGATGAGAIAIDAGKQGEAAQKSVDAGMQATTVAAAAHASTAPIGAAADVVAGANSTQTMLFALQNDLSRRAASLAENARPPKPRQNFLRDILSDKNGISFHRFQIVAWTVVIGVYFVFTVLDACALPQLDNGPHSDGDQRRDLPGLQISGSQELAIRISLAIPNDRGGCLASGVGAQIRSQELVYKPQRRIR